MAAQEEEEWTTIKTTLPTVPLPRSADRSAILSDRLLLRPFAPADLEAYHAMRTQEEVMRWTALGRVDRDRAESQARLDRFLPPNDTASYNCAICLRGGGGSNSGSPGAGDLVGAGGCHVFGNPSFGWPEVGYMLRREHWGRGLATEFLRAFLGAWSCLPRREVELRARRCCLPAAGAGAVEVEEQLVAIVDAANAASQRTLLKCGFERFLEYDEDDLRDPGHDIRLVAFRYFPNRDLRN